MIDPNEDGISHINIYSKGRTELGRFLSNFSDCNIVTEDGPFRTVEGYWLACKDERLRTTQGWESKKLGRELRAPDWPKTPDFEAKIAKAIMLKLTQEWCVQQLKVCTLPFYHYYVYGDRAIHVKDGLWMLNLISDFRDELQKDVRT